MKALRLISCLFILFAFVACSNDDEPSSSGSAYEGLVGNWYDGYNYLISLKKNGKYIAYEYPNLQEGTYEDYWNGKWTYDPETKHLIMYWEKTQDIEDEFDIVVLEEDRFVTNQKDVFTRIPDSQLPTKYIGD